MAFALTFSVTSAYQKVLSLLSITLIFHSQNSLGVGIFSCPSFPFGESINQDEVTRLIRNSHE